MLKIVLLSVTILFLKLEMVGATVLPDSVIVTSNSPQQNSSEYLPISDDESNLINRVVNFNADTLEKQRVQFLAAEKALRLHRSAEYRALLPSLINYPLYPYLQYQDINSRLQKTSVQEFTTFFSQYQDQPVSELLRKRLLLQLAQQGRWQQYLDFADRYFK